MVTPSKSPTDLYEMIKLTFKLKKKNKKIQSQKALCSNQCKVLNSKLKKTKLHHPINCLQVTESLELKVMKRVSLLVKSQHADTERQNPFIP